MVVDKGDWKKKKCDMTIGTYKHSEMNENRFSNVLKSSHMVYAMREAS